MNYTIFPDSGQAAQAIKDTVDLTELVSREETLTNNFGAHASKHASKNGKCLHITPEKQLWQCFSCGQGGDIFSWVMDRDGCEFPQAVDWICQTYNLPHPTLDSEQWEQQKMARQETDLIRPIIKQACQWYHSQLKPMPHLIYLQQRGLKQETIDGLLIGYAPDRSNGLYNHLQQKFGYTDDLLLKTGLFYRNDNGKPTDRYRDRYIFPYWQADQILFSIGRSTQDDEPDKKYIKHLTNSERYPFVSASAVQNIIYGSDSIKDANQLIITEGIIDAILGIQAGYSILSPVTVRFSQNQIQQLVKLAEGASTVYIINDNEESDVGLKGALATAEALYRQGKDVRLVTLPRDSDQEKVDLADFLQSEKNLEPILKTAPGYLNFKIYQLHQFDGAERQRLLKQTAQLLTRLPSFEQEPYIQQVVSEGLMTKRPFQALLKQVAIEGKQEQAQEREQEARRNMGHVEFLRWQVNEIRLNEDKLKDFMVKRNVSSLILEDMKQVGQLHLTEEGNTYWFNKENNKLYEILKDAVDFCTLIDIRYDINASEREYNFVFQAVEAETQANGLKTEIHRLSHFLEGKGLYIHNQDNQIYYLDGQKVELVPNGTDGVLFLSKQGHQPFTYRPNTPTQYMRPMLVENINFDEHGSNLEVFDQRLVFEIWLKSLFFGNLQKTKPIQCFIGEKGSGKSYCQKRVGMFLFGEHFYVDILDKNREDAFIATVTNNAFCAFDNADDHIGWLPTRLAQISTGSQITLRKYYTENQEANYHPKCFVSINARTPNFKRDDVMDRLLPFKVKRFQSFIAENRLTPQLLEARDLIWSDMIDQLNPIVNYLLHDDEATLDTNFRLADFAQFGWKAMRSQKQSADQRQEMGDYWLEILDKLSQAQSEELLVEHPIFMCLEQWMENKDNHDKLMKASELFQELSEVSETHRIGLPYQNARSFGRHMVQIRNNLEQYYTIKVSKYQNQSAYTFSPKND